MQKEIAIFMFIDALGWEIVNKYRFMKGFFPYRYPAKMQFGYSCTAIPTILSGVPPIEHKHLSLFYYDEVNSPFKMFKYFKFLPPQIFSRWRVRHALSRLVAKYYGYTGYFELYAMPFDRLHYFDYIEKMDIFVPGGLKPVPNLADKLEERKLSYHISNWRLTEQQNIDALISRIEEESICFSFLYTAAMDSLLHRVTKDGAEIPIKLAWYQKQIERVVSIAEKHYSRVNLYVMSDHGMATNQGGVDVKRQIENLGFTFGKDYVAIYDSTLGRFWFLNERVKGEIIEKLQSLPHSSLVTKSEKMMYGIDFPDNMYGEEILLMDPGYQIEPCDLGLKALPGMHGYSPEHEDSSASFLSTEEITTPPLWVGDFHRIMVDKMDSIR